MMIELLTSRYPGMRLWLSQRLTALIMVIYIVSLIFALLIVQPKDYLAWYAFANCWVFKLGTGLFFICLTMHAWLGVRDVLRDYVFNKTLRAYLQVIVELLLVVYLIWLTMILCNS
jgi:succinate dehydrogenase / fumarate reductase, membrane anchor subunit